MKICETCLSWEPIKGFYVRPTGSDANAREELAGDCLCPTQQPSMAGTARITCWNETCPDWTSRRKRR